MVLCKDCFHREICESWTILSPIKLDDIPPEIPCGYFKDTADVVPRADVVREFAKFLIDKSQDGIINVDEICDLVIDFLGE